MRPFTSFVVFALLLIVLRRVTGIPISIVGSLVLTVAVNLIMARLTSRRD
jgi:MFS superfamily sulfate permease-like transporter